MDTSLAVKNMRRQSWAMMLREQSASGLSVREWCRQNKISIKCFYYRRRQVQAMVLQAAEEPRFAELTEPGPSYPAAGRNAFAPGAFCFTPELMLSIGDLVIGVSQDTSRQLIADVLQVVRNA